MDYGFYNPFNGFSMQPNGFHFQPMNRYQPTPQMPSQATQSVPEWIMAPSVKQVEQVSAQRGSFLSTNFLYTISNSAHKLPPKNLDKNPS